MAWTLIHDTDFSGYSDTAAGGAGVELVDGWTDELGGIWSIVGGKLFSAEVTSLSSRALLTRLGDPAIVDQRLLVNFRGPVGYAGGASLGAFLRAVGPWWNASQYFASFNSSGRIGKQSAGGAVTTISEPTEWSPPYDETHDYLADFSVLGSSPSVVSLIITDLTSNAVVYTVSVEDSEAGLQDFAGATSLLLYNGNGGGYGVSISRLRTFSASASDLTPGNLAVVSKTPTSVILSYSGTTLGTGPYTTELHRSANPGFTPGAGTLLASNPAFPFTDSSRQLGSSNYILVVTDAAAASASSNELVVSDAPAALILGFIGDSITEQVLPDNMTLPDWVAHYLNRMRTLRDVTIVNRGASGADTESWLPGTARLNDAKAAFALAGVTHVSIMLGTNDSGTVSAADYAENLGLIVADLIAAGYVPILNFAPFIKSDATGKNNRLNEYFLQIQELIAAAETNAVLQGDVLAYAYFQAHQDEYSDDLHPDEVGSRSLGFLQAWAIDRALNPGADIPDPEPEEVDPPVVLRVAAEKSGLQQSDVAQLTLT